MARKKGGAGWREEGRESKRVTSARMMEAMEEERAAAAAAATAAEWRKDSALAGKQELRTIEQ